MLWPTHATSVADCSLPQTNSRIYSCTNKDMLHHWLSTHEQSNFVWCKACLNQRCCCIPACTGKMILTTITTRLHQLLTGHNICWVPWLPTKRNFAFITEPWWARPISHRCFPRPPHHCRPCCRRPTVHWACHLFRLKNRCRQTINKKTLGMRVSFHSPPWYK